MTLNKNRDPVKDYNLKDLDDYLIEADRIQFEAFYAALADDDAEESVVAAADEEAPAEEEAPAKE